MVRSRAHAVMLLARARKAVSMNKKLIECVKEYTFLFDKSDEKYGNCKKKDDAWNEIGVKLKMDGNECKKKWSLLRDGFRRAAKKKKDCSCGPYKKWKYEDDMAFLFEHNIVSFNRTWKNNVTPTIVSFGPVGVPPDPTTSSLDKAEPIVKIEIDEEILQPPDVLQNIRAPLPCISHPQPMDDIEKFFAGITTTVLSFPVKDRALAKAKIFEVVSKMEIEILSRPSTASTSSPYIMEPKLKHF